MFYRALIVAALLSCQFANQSVAQAPEPPPSNGRQVARPRSGPARSSPNSTFILGGGDQLTVYIANSPAPIKARKLLILGWPTRPKTTKTPKSSYAELTAKNLEVPYSLINEDRRNHVVHDNTLTRPTDIEYARLDPTRGVTNSAGALTTP